jgi:hypothetical protein
MLSNRDAPPALIRGLNLAWTTDPEKAHGWKGAKRSYLLFLRSPFAWQGDSLMDDRVFRLLLRLSFRDELSRSSISPTQMTLWLLGRHISPPSL